MYKQKGETPLQGLDRLRARKEDLVGVKMSYAGRLDPMAEGVMIVLIGEECKDREKYLGLDKMYVTEILFGVGTDTADILGKISASQKSVKSVKSKDVEKELQKMVGKMNQKYPAYSSKSFAGSYEDAHIGNVAEHSHEVEVYSAELFEVREISSHDLLKKIQEDIARVKGDFRQEEIVKLWEKNIPRDVSQKFCVVKIRLVVSSGFYVRQFAEDLGESIGVPALALSIIREKVGEYGIHSCEL